MYVNWASQILNLIMNDDVRVYYKLNDNFYVYNYQM